MLVRSYFCDEDLRTTYTVSLLWWNLYIMHWSKLQVYLDSTRGQNYLAMLYDHKAGSECVGNVRLFAKFVNLAKWQNFVDRFQVLFSTKLQQNSEKWREFCSWPGKKREKILFFKIWDITVVLIWEKNLKSQKSKGDQRWPKVTPVD